MALSAADGLALTCLLLGVSTLVWHDAVARGLAGMQVWRPVHGPRLRLTVVATGVAYVAIGVLLLLGRSGPALALSNLALVGLMVGLVRPPRPWLVSPRAAASSCPRPPRVDTSLSARRLYCPRVGDSAGLTAVSLALLGWRSCGQRAGSADARAL